MRFYLTGNEFIDMNDPIDISIGIRDNNKGVQAWYVDPPSFEPVMEHGFVGSVAQGGNVNFRNVKFNPHGNGTHTESYGHITEDIYPVSNCFEKFFFKCSLASILPRENSNGDKIITKEQLLTKFSPGFSEALIIRTLPNQLSKLELNYSNTNPPYLDVECVALLNEWGVQHLLVDIPSVDKEIDGGELAFHHKFWNVPIAPISSRTITELIFVANEIEDGNYLLEIQLANFENDAAPSRPILYKIKKEG